MTPEEIAAKRHYHAKLFRDANAFIKPERVPHLGSFISWKILDAGYKFSEAFNDFEVLEKTQRYFLDNYKIDTLMGGGGCMPFRVTEAMGRGYFYYNDETECVGVEDFTICDVTDLLEYAKDPAKIMWTVSAGRKFKDWNNKTLADFQKSVDEYNKFFAYIMRIGEVIKNEYGLPVIMSGALELASEVIFKLVRGIKNFSLDMRRNPEIIKEAISIMDERLIAPVEKRLRDLPFGPDLSLEACYDLGVLVLAHTVMNNKQFEKFYWPSLKRVFDIAEDTGKQVRITVEGSGERIFDCFAEYPKGILALHLEQDDIFETRKRLHNCALIGGMPVTMLGGGTKQQCIDLTKKLIDELGSNGGYIFSENKFVCYRNDANSENLKAVCDFIVNYRS